MAVVDGVQVGNLLTRLEGAERTLADVVRELNQLENGVSPSFTIDATSSSGMVLGVSGFGTTIAAREPGLRDVVQRVESHADAIRGAVERLVADLGHL